jgi:hypothetical protein
MNGNPHPLHGDVVDGNPNVQHHWHHDALGAVPAVHADLGMNNEQIQQAQEELVFHQAEEAVDQGWGNWQQNEDNFQQEEHQQLESYSFDQSGSTAQYLRAHGTDSVLNIDDVMSSSSSSSGSVTSTVQATQMPAVMAVVESRAFASLFTSCIPRGWPSQSSVIPQEVNINKDIVIETELPPKQGSWDIVPFKVVPAVALLRFWAETRIGPTDNIPAQENADMETENDTLSNQDDCLGSSSGEVQQQKFVTLPKVVSKTNSTIPLEESSVRRSSRLSQNKAGFKHFQLEDHPRKKQRVWAEVPVKMGDGAKLLDNPPKPTDEAFPAQIPVDILKGWGLDCNVAPEELTEEALSQGRSTHDA